MIEPIAGTLLLVLSSMLVWLMLGKVFRWIEKR